MCWTGWLGREWESQSHRRNNHRNRGRLVPPTMYWSPQLLGHSFQKARNSTASSHQNAGFGIWVFTNFPGWYHRTLTTPSPVLWPGVGRLLGSKSWSPSTFQPWLCPWSVMVASPLLHTYCSTDHGWSILLPWCNLSDLTAILDAARLRDDCQWCY